MQRLAYSSSRKHGHRAARAELRSIVAAMKRRRGISGTLIVLLAVAVAVGASAATAESSTGKRAYGKPPLPGKWTLTGLGLAGSQSSLILKKQGKRFTITHMRLYLPPQKCPTFAGSYADLVTPVSLGTYVRHRFGKTERFWVTRPYEGFEGKRRANATIRVQGQLVEAHLAFTFARGRGLDVTEKPNGGDLDLRHEGDECDPIFYGHHRRPSRS